MIDPYIWAGRNFSPCIWRSSAANPNEPKDNYSHPTPASRREAAHRRWAQRYRLSSNEKSQILRKETWCP